MERDFKRRIQHTAPTLQQRLQRRADKPDTSAQQAARAEQQAARQANFETFVQRFATTPEARLASDVLTTNAPTTEHQSAARALPGAGRVRLQRLLQSQHVAGSLSLGREALNPVQRASDQTIADLTGLPTPAATLPTQSLETRLQRHRDAKITQSATLEPSAPQQHLNLERPAPQLAGNSLNLQAQRADDGQNQLGRVDPTLRQNVQRSPAHSDAVTDHIAVAQTARVQRQRAVNTRAGELKGEMLSAQVQRLRAPDAPNLEASGRAYTLTGQADRINTELPLMRAKHNHDPAYLDGDTKPVTDFARHVGLSMGRQYHVQRTKAGAKPADLSTAISRVHDGHDRANLLTSTLTTFHPNDREAASVQRLVAERETELEVQRLALETDLQPVTQRLAEREAEHTENLSAMIARAGGGEELPEKVKRQLQPQFNFSLDIVRIHRDGYADQLAKTVNAVAFTTGTSIFFRSGKYDPNSAGGRGLLVHELTHVGQQLEGLVSPGPEKPHLEGIAQTAGDKEESKGALPETEARDSDEVRDFKTQRQMPQQVALKSGLRIQAKKEPNNLNPEGSPSGYVIAFTIPSVPTDQNMMLACLQELNPIINLEQYLRFLFWLFQGKVKMDRGNPQFFQINEEEKASNTKLARIEYEPYLSIRNMTVEAFEKQLEIEWKFEGNIEEFTNSVMPIDEQKMKTIAKDINASWWLVKKFSGFSEMLDQLRNCSPREIEFLHKYYSDFYGQSLSEVIEEKFSGVEKDEIKLRLEIKTKLSTKDANQSRAEAAVMACYNSDTLTKFDLERIREIINGLTIAEHKIFLKLTDLGDKTPEYVSYRIAWGSVVHSYNSSSLNDLAGASGIHHRYIDALRNRDQKGMLNAKLEETTELVNVNVGNLLKGDVSRGLTDQDAFMKELVDQAKRGTVKIDEKTREQIEKAKTSGYISVEENAIVEAAKSGDRQKVIALDFARQLKGLFWSQEGKMEYIRKSLGESENPSQIVDVINSNANNGEGWQDVVNTNGFTKYQKEYLISIATKEGVDPNLLIAIANESGNIAYFEDLMKGKSIKEIEEIEKNWLNSTKYNPNRLSIENFLVKQKPKDTLDISLWNVATTFVGSNAVKVRKALAGEPDSVKSQLVYVKADYDYTRNPENNKIANFTTDTLEKLGVNESASQVDKAYENYKALFSDFDKGTLKDGVTEDLAKKYFTEFMAATGSYNNQTGKLREFGKKVVEAAVYITWIAVTKTAPPAWLVVALLGIEGVVRKATDSDYGNKEFIIDMIKAAATYGIEKFAGSQTFLKMIEAVEKEGKGATSKILNLLVKNKNITEETAEKLLKKGFSNEFYKDLFTEIANTASEVSSETFKGKDQNILEKTVLAATGLTSGITGKLLTNGTINEIAAKSIQYLVSGTANIFAKSPGADFDFSKEIGELIQGYCYAILPGSVKNLAEKSKKLKQIILSKIPESQKVTKMHEWFTKNGLGTQKDVVNHLVSLSKISNVISKKTKKSQKAPQKLKSKPPNIDKKSEKQDKTLPESKTRPSTKTSFKNTPSQLKKLKSGEATAKVYIVNKKMAEGDWEALKDPKNWTVARQRLHKELLDNAEKQAIAFAEAAAGQTPTLYALSGNTGVGKSRAIIEGIIAELTNLVAATPDMPHRAVNPDNFKTDLCKATPGVSLTSTQVHSESSMLASVLQDKLLLLKTKDGKPASILVDRRLASLADVQDEAAKAKKAGLAFNLSAVDASLEVSLAGVLEREPGGDSPIPDFDIIGGGFTAVRADRLAVIDYFQSNPTVGKYELFATTAQQERVKVAVVEKGELKIETGREELFKEVTAPTGELANQIGRKTITASFIDDVTSQLSSSRAKKVSDTLTPYIGKTWKDALDEHSKKKPETKSRKGRK